MAILWAGGEDTSFPNGGSTQQITTSGTFRAGYARYSIFPAATNVLCRSVPFAGGAVTSAWISVQAFVANPGSVNRPKMIFGVGLSGTSKCLMLGGDATVTQKMSLFTYDGTTTTEIASEPGASWQFDILQKIDIQIISFGASATVHVYNAGALVFSFTGDVTLSGFTHFDSMFFYIDPAISTTNHFGTLSEFIVASEDTRSLNVCTLSPSGAGDTDDWTGVYSTINGLAINDSSPNFVNLTAKDQQFIATDLPAGAWVIKALKQEARLAVSTGPPVATEVQLGYKSGGTIAFGGSPLALINSYTTYEQLDAVNPVTSATWTQADVNAVQFDLRSS